MKKIIAIILGLAMALLLSACIIPVKPSDSDTPDTPASPDTPATPTTPDTPKPSDKPADPKPTELVPFDNVFFADGTTYVGIPSTFPFLEVEPVGKASMYWLDIPGTTPVKKADFFAIYNGKLYFSEFIHPTDAAARRTCLYMANLDGSNRKVVVDDVAASTKPVIVNGVLYYLSYIPDEGETVYTYDGDNGGQIKASDAANCTSILKSYDMTTGKTATVEVGRTISAQFTGASTDRLFVATESRDNTAKITSMALDFSDAKEFTVPGYPVGVDEKGHIVVRAYKDSVYEWSICDSSGKTLKSVTSAKYSGVYSSSRYLIYEDAGGALVVFDTVKLSQVERVSKKDDWSTSRYYYYYEPADGTVYFIGRHGTITGTYKGYSSGEDHSVFAVDKDGQVRRILPYTDVTWRRTGSDWKSAKAYILQWSEIDFYTYEQLSTLSNEELFYGRNEMFWAHGRDFTGEAADSELTKFFKAKSWPRELTGKKLTAAERSNLKIIEQIEAERKSPYAGRGYTYELMEKLGY